MRTQKRRLRRDGGSRRRIAGAVMTGEELRELRTKAGLSQEELATRANYHPVHVMALERGRYRIGARAARALRRALEKEAQPVLA